MLKISHVDNKLKIILYKADCIILFLFTQHLPASQNNGHNQSRTSNINIYNVTNRCNKNQSYLSTFRIQLQSWSCQQQTGNVLQKPLMVLTQAAQAYK